MLRADVALLNLWIPALPLWQVTFAHAVRLFAAGRHPPVSSEGGHRGVANRRRQRWWTTAAGKHEPSYCAKPRVTESPVQSAPEPRSPIAKFSLPPQNRAQTASPNPGGCKTRSTELRRIGMAPKWGSAVPTTGADVAHLDRDGVCIQVRAESLDRSSISARADTSTGEEPALAPLSIQTHLRNATTLRERSLNPFHSRELRAALVALE
jgi:hypothetical protein